MKIVCLDADTLGNDVDLDAVFGKFGEFVSYNMTEANQTVQRLQNADIVLTNKVLITKDVIAQTNLKLICVTNNPVLPARKTLDALGVSEFFPEIVGLDTCYKSKPALEPFIKACQILKLDAKNCLAIGDRYDMDISLPLEMGMGGILVKGVEEIYNLHSIIYANA